MSGATEYGLSCFCFHTLLERPALLRQWHRRGFQPRRSRPGPKKRHRTAVSGFRPRPHPASHLQSHFGDGNTTAACPACAVRSGLLTEAEFEQRIRGKKEALSSPYALTQTFGSGLLWKRTASSSKLTIVPERQTRAAWRLRSPDLKVATTDFTAGTGLGPALRPGASGAARPSEILNAHHIAACAAAGDGHIVAVRQPHEIED